MTAIAETAAPESVPIWAQDSRGLFANTDMLAIGFTLLVVIAVKLLASLFRRRFNED
ncbi:MAG: hypothetical protein AAGL24_21800 [Pseudomonadota bacterium]